MASEQEQGQEELQRPGKFTEVEGDVAQENSVEDRIELSLEVLQAWVRFRRQWWDNRFIVQNRWINMSKSERREFLEKNWRASGGSEIPREHRQYLK